MDAEFDNVDKAAFTSQAFRQALGSFATGVVVVTTHPAGYNPIGLTVNSFASVSLDPPLILWSLDRNSETQAPFMAADHFAVNVLSVKQEDLSARFSTRGKHDLQDGEFDRRVTGSPILAGTLAQFDCEVFERIDGGDHVILIGKVLHIGREDGEPLLFSGGRYGRLGP